MSCSRRESTPPLLMTPRAYILTSWLVLCMSCNASDKDDGNQPGDGDGDGDGDTGTGGSETASGGSTPSGGSTFSGGNSSAGGSTSSGGMALGGEGPDMGGGGLGGSGDRDSYVVPADAVPSAGCSLPATEPDDMTSTSGTVYVSAPAGYDGSTPLPLILGFPSFGTRLEQILDADSSFSSLPSSLAEDYVIVRADAQTSNHSTWEGNDIEPFDEVYQMVRENVCFDEARVFGVGNEDGARYLTKHVCEPAPGDLTGPNIFRALAIVGFQTSPCAPWPDLPLLFLHSTETEVAWGDPDGRKALADFKEAISCGDTSTPAGTWPVGSSFDYECEDIDGCTSDLRFCSWNQPIDGTDIWLETHNEHLHRFFADHL